MTVSVLKDLRDLKDKDEEAFLDEYDLTMTTILSNGDEVELIPGGKH